MLTNIPDLRVVVEFVEASAADRVLLVALMSEAERDFVEAALRAVIEARK